MRTLSDVTQADTRNTVLGWTIIATLILVVFENFLDGDLLWAGFTALAAGLSVLPPVLSRERAMVVPWQILLVLLLPIGSHSLATNPFLTQVTTYLSVVALALVLTIEIHLFTPVKLTVGVALVFGVLATMAVAGLWAIAQWISDLYLGTRFIQGELDLQWELVAATLTGLLGAVLFFIYFKFQDGYGFEAADRSDRS